MTAAFAWFRRNRLPLAAVLAVGSIVGLFTVIRSQGLRSEEAAQRRDFERQRDDAIAAGQRAYRQIGMRQLRELASAGDLVTMLQEAGGDKTDAPAAAAERDALLKHAGEFLYYRFVQPSPQAYRQWREANGYRFRDPEALRAGGLEAEYAYWFDEPYPGDPHFVEVFDRMWEGSLGFRGGRSRPVALAMERSGVEVAFGQVDITWAEGFPRLSGEYDAETWHGLQQVALARDWWTDPHGGIHEELHRSESVERGARVRIALVGVVMEMLEGDRYPITLTFYQDDSGNWWLWRMNALNVAMERLVQLEI